MLCAEAQGWFPHPEERSLLYMSSLPSSILSMASVLLVTARKGAPKREWSRGCSPGELCGLGSMSASSSFANLMLSATVFSEHWKVLGRCKGLVRAYVPFQGREVPYFDQNLMLFDGITKFVQVLDSFPVFVLVEND